MPKARCPLARATASTVPEPAIGSRTRSVPSLSPRASIHALHCSGWLQVWSRSRIFSNLNRLSGRNCLRILRALRFNFLEMVWLERHHA